MKATRPRSDARPSRRSASGRDRLLATIVAGPIGRGLSFSIELAAAIRRGLRGELQDPEERRY